MHAATVLSDFAMTGATIERCCLALLRCARHLWRFDMSTVDAMARATVGRYWRATRNAGSVKTVAAMANGRRRRGEGDSRIRDRQDGVASEVRPQVRARWPAMRSKSPSRARFSRRGFDTSWSFQEQGLICIDLSTVHRSVLNHRTVRG